MERIVLDTNVLIDGARDEHAASARILQDVLDGVLVAAVSRPLRDEYAQLMHRAVSDPRYHDRIRQFLDVAETVRVGRTPRVIAEDPEDDKVLATAVAAQAQALISSDRHLLARDPYEGIRIVTPQEFVNLRSEEDGGAWSDFAQSLGIGKET